MTTALGHDVRVLVCEGCGAPLEVPVQGGLVRCGHCRATSEVVARREEALGRAGSGSSLDERHRLEILRLQDGKPLLLDADLRHYVAAGGLLPAKEASAHRDWQDARDRLRREYSTEIERRLYLLTTVLAEHLWANGEHLRSRAVLESAVEAYRARRYRQLALCALARHAAVLGDRASADAWLRPCDPAPLDLHMDTAFRYTRTFLLRADERWHDVLVVLGRSGSDVPIADHSDDLLAMYRADALEHVEGVDAAADALVARTEKDPFAYFSFVGVRASSPYPLCPRSLEAARQRLPVWNRTLGCKPAGCFVVWVIVGAALSINGWLAEDERFLPPLVGWIVAGLLAALGAPIVGLLAWVDYRLWGKRTARQAAKERAA